MAGAGEQGEGKAPAHVVVVRVEEPVAVPTARAEDDNLQGFDTIKFFSRVQNRNMYRVSHPIIHRGSLDKF